MLNNELMMLIVAALAIWLIVRQFREQAITPRSLLIYPILIAFYTYTNITGQLAHPFINPAILVGCFIVGLLPGALLGLFRGMRTSLRLDQMSGIVYARPSVTNALLWLGMIALKVLSGVAQYSGFAHTSMLGAILIALTTTIFIGYICTTYLVLYLRAQNFQVSNNSIEQPAPQQMVKW